MTHSAMPCRDKGLTLIELSVVLVIIGLIASGVLVGQELIRASTLRAVMTESQTLKTALNAFVTKYGALPGDMANAQAMFGATLCPDDGGGGTNPCNGNGIIDDTAGYEDTRAMMHMYIAGIYTGPMKIWTDNGGGMFARSRYEGSDWRVTFGRYYYVFKLTDNSTAGPYYDPATIGSKDAQYIELKIDDGKPQTGGVQANTPGGIWGWAINNCYASGVYMTSYTGAGCILDFKTDY